MQTILIELIEQATSATSANVITSAVQALMLLPGIIEAVRPKRHGEQQDTEDSRLAQTTCDLLKTITDNAGHMAASILWRATVILTPPQRAPTHQPSARKSTATTLQRADNCIRRGQIRTGVRQLREAQQFMDAEKDDQPRPEMPSLTHDQYLQAVTDSNPAPATQPVYPPIPEGIVSATVTPDAVQRAVRSLTANTSEGADSWSPRLLVSIFNRATPEMHAKLIDSLRLLTNKILSGTMPAAVRHALFPIREVIVHKIDKSTGAQKGLRHIKIFPIFTRLIRRIIRSLTKHVGKELAQKHHQMGIAIRGGCDIIARTCQGQYDRGRPILDIDCKNAFPSIDRRKVYEAAISHVPGIAHLLHWADLQSLELYGPGALHVGTVHSGCIQGDSLSTDLYCMAVGPVLDKVHAEIERIEAQYINSEYPSRSALPADHTPGTSASYIDDTSIFSDWTPVLLQLAPRLPAFFAEIGVEINLKKSSLIARDAEDWPESEDARELGITLRTQGSIVLGIPYGTQEYVEEQLRQRCRQKPIPIDALMQIPLRLSLPLMRISLCRTWQYHAAIIEHPNSHNILAAVDRDQMRAINTLLDLDPSDISDTLCTLSWGHSGMGIAAITGMTHEGLRLSSRKLVTETVTNMPKLNAMIQLTQQTWSSIQYGQVQDVVQEAALAVTTISEVNHATLLTEIRKARERGEAEILRRLKRVMRETPGHSPYLAYVASAEGDPGKATKAFMQSSFLQLPEAYFTEKAVASIARLALAQNPLGPRIQGRDRYCQCGHEHSLEIDWSHALNCSQAKFTTKQRHDNVVDIVATFCRTVDPTATVRTNPPIGAQHHMADVLYQTPQRSIFIDVVVGNPLSRPAIERNPSTVDFPDAITDHKEHEKRRHYLNILGPAQEINRHVVPAAFDATGRSGRSIRLFIAELGAKDPRAKLRTRQRIAQVLVVHAGRLFAEQRNRLYLAAPRRNASYPEPPMEPDPDQAQAARNKERENQRASAAFMRSMLRPRSRPQRPPAHAPSGAANNSGSTSGNNSGSCNDRGGASSNSGSHSSSSSNSHSNSNSGSSTSNNRHGNSSDAGHSRPNPFTRALDERPDPPWLHEGNTPPFEPTPRADSPHTPHTPHTPRGHHHPTSPPSPTRSQPSPTAPQRPTHGPPGRAQPRRDAAHDARPQAADSHTQQRRTHSDASHTDSRTQQPQAESPNPRITSTDRPDHGIPVRQSRQNEEQREQEARQLQEQQARERLQQQQEHSRQQQQQQAQLRQLQQIEHQRQQRQLRQHYQPITAGTTADKIRRQRIDLPAWSDQRNIDGRDPYIVLGLDSRKASSYSTADISKAYRQTSRKLHPDRCQDKQHEKFQILGDANNILNDPARRTEIDNIIASRLSCLKRYNQYPGIQEKAYAQYVNAEGKDVTLAAVLDSVAVQFLDQDFDSFHNQPATPTQPAASSTRDGTRSARTNNAATNNTNTNNNGRGRGGTRHA